MGSPLNTTMGASSSLALDTQSLAALRAQAAQSPDRALKAAAQQFEAIFMNMMLKSMREATSQEGLMDNDQSRMFTGMLDQQLTQSMSSRGIGLADMMVRQLSRNGQGMTPPPAAGISQLGGVPTTPAVQSSASVQAAPVRAAVPGAAAIPSAFNASTQQDFVNRMLPHALQASRESGVPAHLMMGQAALESGWGKREIVNADGSNSYNLFGIKATGGWKGRVAEVTTTEYVNGVPHKQVEKFRAYDSYTEAFKDYAAMIGGNPRYAGVMRQGGDALGMAQALQQSGYATDPRYADKLVSVIRQMKISA